MERLDQGSFPSYARAPETDMSRPPTPQAGTLAKSYSKSLLLIAIRSVADPGSEFFFPHPGADFFPYRIRIKLSIINPKIFLSSRKYHQGCSSRTRISNPDLNYLPIPDPGVKEVPTGSQIPVPQHWLFGTSTRARDNIFKYRVLLK